MVIDALLEAEPYLQIAEQVDKPEKYVYLTDEIMAKIESSTEPVRYPTSLSPSGLEAFITPQELAKSRDIFERIHTRDLYRCVDYKVFSWEHRELCRAHITPERIAEAAQEVYAAHLQAQDVEKTGVLFSANNVIVDLSYMHYGMEEKNPMHSIKFYSKNNPDRESKSHLS